MKIAVIENVVRDLKGIAFKEGDEKSPDLTIKEALIRSISAPPQSQQEIVTSPEESSKEYMLGLKVARATADTDFSVEDLALLKKKVCKIGFTSIISGQVCDALDGKE